MSPILMEILVVWEILAKISGGGQNDPPLVFSLIKRPWVNRVAGLIWECDIVFLGHDG